MSSAADKAVTTTVVIGAAGEIAFSASSLSKLTMEQSIWILRRAPRRSRQDSSIKAVSIRCWAAGSAGAQLVWLPRIVSPPHLLAATS